MHELPPSSKYLAAASEPVDDAEREQMSTRLGDAYAAGVLDEEAYRSALDEVFAAERLGDLAGVAAMLPAKPVYETPAMVAESTARPPGQVSPGGRGQLFFALGASVALLALFAVLIAMIVLF